MKILIVFLFTFFLLETGLADQGFRVNPSPAQKDAKRRCIDRVNRLLQDQGQKLKYDAETDLLTNIVTHADGTKTAEFLTPHGRIKKSGTGLQCIDKNSEQYPMEFVSGIISGLANNVHKGSKGKLKRALRNVVTECRVLSGISRGALAKVNLHLERSLPTTEERRIDPRNMWSTGALR